MSYVLKTFHTFGSIPSTYFILSDRGFVIIHFLHNYSYYFPSFLVFFISRRTLSNISFFACAFENLMKNFLTLYFRYSDLTGSSKMFPFSRKFKQMDACSLILPINSLFNVKELLKIHKPLPLAIICNLFRVKGIGE